MRFAAMLLSVLFSAQSLGAPTPSIVALASIWTLDAVCGGLWSINVNEGLVQRYWYLIISIENCTGVDVDLVPQADFATDTFQIRPAGIGVGTGVFEQIKARHQHMYPFLQPWPMAPERIMPGPDYARDYMLVWPDIDNKAVSVSVFIGGLSNEMSVIDHPTIRQPDDRPLKVYLRKTLQLDFVIGPSRSEPASPVSTSWVMR